MREAHCGSGKALKEERRKVGGDPQFQAQSAPDIALAI